MDLYHLIHRLKKKPSINRASLRTATHEGFSAVIIMHIIGGPFLTAYLLYLGATSAQIGLALAIPPLANLVQVIVAIYMNKFKDRKKFLVVFGGAHRIIWVSTGMIPFIFPHESWVIIYIIIYFISFISASITTVIWTSLIADVVPPQVRGRYFGIRNMMLWAVASLSILVGGQILDRYQESTGFIILYSISAICVVWNIFVLSKFPNPLFEESIEVNKLKKFLKPFQDRLYIKLVGFISIFILLQQVAVPLFAYVMLDIMDVRYQWVSIITTVHLIVMMISYYFWGNLNAKIATRKLIFWTFPILSLSCIAWLGLSVLPSLLVLFMVHIFLGIGIGGSNLLLFNYIIGDSPRSERPMYIAVFFALTGITGFIGPMFGGYIFKLVQHTPYWIQSYGIFTSIGFLMMSMTMIGFIVFRESNK